MYNKLCVRRGRFFKMNPAKITDEGNAPAVDSSKRYC